MTKYKDTELNAFLGKKVKVTLIDSRTHEGILEKSPYDIALKIGIFIFGKSCITKIVEID